MSGEEGMTKSLEEGSCERTRSVANRCLRAVSKPTIEPKRGAAPRRRGMEWVVAQEQMGPGGDSDEGHNREDLGRESERPRSGEREERRSKKVAAWSMGPTSTTSST